MVMRVTINANRSVVNAFPGERNTHTEWFLNEPSKVTDHRRRLTNMNTTPAQVGVVFFYLVPITSIIGKSPIKKSAIARKLVDDALLSTRYNRVKSCPASMGVKSDC